MSILSAGAGASEGLDEVLRRMMLQNQMAETSRHNQADEALRGRGLDLQSLLRQDTLNEKKNTDIEKEVGARGIGDPVSEAEMSREVGAGTPSSLYNVIPGAKVKSTIGLMPLAQASAQSMGPGPQATDAVPGQPSQATTTEDPASPLNAPRTINFRGTGTQRAALTEAQRRAADSFATQTAKEAATQAAQEKLELTGKLNEATINRSNAEAELAREKAAHPNSRQVPFTEVDQVSNMNSAEIQATKVLRHLKESGLDQSNDPVDPRFNTFVAQNLKVRPLDEKKADDIQRTNYAKAVLARAIMGGRPSQYMMQIIEQHLPDSKMSGKQLAGVIRDVLDEVGTKRVNMQNFYGPDEASKLEPVGGETYQQFLKSSGKGGPTGAGGGTTYQLVDGKWVKQ